MLSRPFKLWRTTSEFFKVPLSRSNLSCLRRGAKNGHPRMLLFSGSIGLLACAVSDVQREEKSHIMSLRSSTGPCVTIERWSNSGGNSSGLTTESVHVFKANRQSIVLSTSEFQFSPTLKYTCITIADCPEPNGRVVAERLVDKLPFAVSLTLADAYSTAAANGASPSLTGRNPGELPNPVPKSSDIDSAIEEAFQLVNETMLDTLDPSRGDILSGSSSHSVLMGIFNLDDRSLRVASSGNNHGHTVIFGRRRVIQPSSHSPPGSPGQDQVKYDLENLSPTPLRRVEDPIPHPLALEAKNRSLTPPNIANPGIAVQENIQPGDFAIFCTSQLLKYLTKEEITGLVGLWVKENTDAKHDQKQVTQPIYAFSESDLPLAPTSPTLVLTSQNHEPTKATLDEETDKASHKKFVFCQHDTIGFHLLRNALWLRGGQSQQDIFSSFLPSLQLPLSSSSKQEREWTAQEKVISDSIEKEGGISLTIVLF